MKVNNLTLFFFFFLVASYSYSQTSTSSPYSIYGIGDLEPKGNPANAAMGGSKYAFSNPNYVNNANPATYSSLVQPLFQVDAVSNFLTLSTNTAEESVNNTYLKNITFGFPLKKNRWGMSFGLLPYTKMGYAIMDSEEIEGFGTVGYNYEGDGNISQVYLGHGIKIFQSDSNKQSLSLGINGYYMFGALRKRRQVSPSDLNSYDINELNQANIGDVHVDFGLLYERKVANKIRLKLGAHYSIGDSLRGRNIIFTTTDFSQGVANTLKDTVRNDTISDQKVYLPQAIGIGLGLQFSNKVLLQADYYTQDWTKFTYFGQTNLGLQTQTRISVGLQYTPDVKEVNSFFKTMRYRIGYRNENTRLVVKGQQLRETGINFGIGLPLAKGQSTGTSLNIAAEFGSRGSINNGLIKESFTNLNIGFTFAPHKFDEWFKKREIE